MSENRDWKDLDCIFKKAAWISFTGDAYPRDLIKCDGPGCAQFDPNFKGCSSRK